MAPQPSEADIILNRANVALAKSQRLVASWLPPRTEEEVKNAITEEEMEKEEQEMFTPVPELLGLGAKVPNDFKDADMKRQNSSSNDLLRRQLLGKDRSKVQNNGVHRQGDQRGLGGVLHVGSKPRPAPAKRKVEDVSSDEEGGRSSVGKRKHLETAKATGNEEVEVGQLGLGPGRRERSEAVKRSKRVTNYLDEVLSRKSEKKQRNKKRKKVAQDSTLVSKD
ncbi:MAG: hypothetical protein LQ338_002982 [Usnochroma carphineum]|nr:MAG: hypothetical protein LQ338_002982 [Usnochroma carphineum]